MRIRLRVNRGEYLCIVLEWVIPAQECYTSFLVVSGATVSNYLVGRFLEGQSDKHLCSMAQQGYLISSVLDVRYCSPDTNMIPFLVYRENWLCCLALYHAR